MLTRKPKGKAVARNERAYVIPPLTILRMVKCRPCSFVDVAIASSLAQLRYR
jgi:hypothetical protein